MSITSSSLENTLSSLQKTLGNMAPERNNGAVPVVRLPAIPRIDASISVLNSLRYSSGTIKIFSCSSGVSIRPGVSSMIQGSLNTEPKNNGKKVLLSVPRVSQRAISSLIITFCNCSFCTCLIRSPSTSISSSGEDVSHIIPVI